MVGSLVVGSLLVFLGGICVIAGVVNATLEALKPKAGFAPASVTKVLKLVVEILKAFGKLRPAAQLLVTGSALIAVGIWLLAARPF